MNDVAYPSDLSDEELDRYNARSRILERLLAHDWNMGQALTALERVK